MFVSLLLHLLIFVITIAICRLGVQKNRKINKNRFKWNTYYFIGFSVLLIFIGLRDGLGRDWENYLIIFSNPNDQDFIFGETREFGFITLINLCHILHIEFRGFVFILSAITLFFFFKAFRKNYFLLPAGIFIFFVDIGYPSIINIIRQTWALCAFIWAITYIGERGKAAIVKYLLLFAIGGLFHYSMLMFLPVWFCGRVEIKLKTLIFLCVFIYLFCSQFLLGVYGGILDLIPKYSSYENANHIFNEKITFGFGATLLLLLRLMPLVCYNRVLYIDKEFVKYFVTYYIGLSIYYGFYDYLLIARITFYFQFCEIIIMPYFLSYVTYKFPILKNLRICFVFLFLFNFVYTFREFIMDHALLKNYTIMFFDFNVS